VDEGAPVAVTDSPGLSGSEIPITANGRPVVRATLTTGRSVVALLSAAVLATTWYGWDRMRTVNDGLTTTDVIESPVAAGSDSDPRKPLDGAVDILLVGMDSRVDAQGNPLSKEMLAELNAGVSDGELNTDTMILVHIPVDGTHAVAISFPRDSYVEIADGFGKHKLNSAFARERNTRARELANEGVTDQARINQEAATAGRRTLIKTIENLTGGAVKIDRYAEVNLASFYEMSKALGGVEVCLNHDTHDDASGADFTAGRHVISGAQALAFVRQRDNLPGGDLDRIVRQQAFIGALAKKVLSAGTLANPGKLDDLLTAVQKSVVLSQGWDIAGFAEQLSGLVGGNIQFRTIPVGPPMDTYGDGNVLQVNPAQVKAFVTGLAGDETTPSTTPSVTPTSDPPPHGAPRLSTPDTTSPSSFPSTPGGLPTQTQLITASGVPCVN
jgi:LCP family protein required for cell wall assembly